MRLVNSRKALCFTAVFLCFFSSRDLRGPWANLREILSHGRKRVKFTNAGPKIWGAKNTLNLARFRTCSQFELEYLRNGLNIVGAELTWPEPVLLLDG